MRPALPPPRPVHERWTLATAVLVLSMFFALALCLDPRPTTDSQPPDGPLVLHGTHSHQIGGRWQRVHALLDCLNEVDPADSAELQGWTRTGREVSPEVRDRIYSHLQELRQLGCYGEYTGRRWRETHSERSF